MDSSVKMSVECTVRVKEARRVLGGVRKGIEQKNRRNNCAAVRANGVPTS